MGSRISFSTRYGDASGYGMPTTTTGGATSGNSSVFSLSNANKPNTTSATIATTVMRGRLIAKSEMNMKKPVNGERVTGYGRFASLGADTLTGVPGVIPRAAPSNTVSPAARPAATSTVSAAASRIPSVTSTLSIFPFFNRTTVGRRPRSSTALIGTIGAVRISVATRPSANNPPTSVLPEFGMAAMIFTWRVAASAVGFTRVIRPRNVRVGYPVTLNSTGIPTRTWLSCSAGTDASSCIDAGSTTVYSAVPDDTTSPALTCRAATTPANGARTVAFSSDLVTFASAARAFASCALAASS